MCWLKFQTLAAACRKVGMEGFMVFLGGESEFPYFLIGLSLVN
jgi:hypothetical protein